MAKTIIALGGAGFYKTDLILERYVLSQSSTEKPAILFLPTASGDSAQYIVWFYEVFNQLRCVPHHLSLTSNAFQIPVGMTLEEYVLSHDIIWVGGGNTKNMLALWREWGLDVILFKAWNKGIVLAGISAGSLCWFEQGITDSLPHRLSVLDCLGFLPGSNCPHYNDESKRRPAYEQCMASGQIKAGIAQDQFVALHYQGTELYRVVTNRAEQKAYVVSKQGNQVIETVLDAEVI